MREPRPVVCLTCIYGNAIIDGAVVCVQACLLTYILCVKGKGSYLFFFVFATRAALRGVTSHLLYPQTASIFFFFPAFRAP